MMRAIWLAGVAMALFMSAGCEKSSDDAPGAYWNVQDDAAAPAGNTATAAAPAGGAQPAGGGAAGGGNVASGASFSLGSVHWLHANVSGWAQTATLSGVKISGGSITLNYNKAKVWPAVGGLNANPWIFVNRDGKWYGATWEWLRHGQTTKSAASVRGDHIKKAPLNNFAPVSGETYGFMVSGLARDKSTRNVSERSNVVMVRWP
jgi:hypothetical protein